MFQKIKNFNRLIRTNNELLTANNSLLRELEWAHIFHDSIKGKKPLENLSLNVGRWAGNYSFFYILNRILFDYDINKILEFGLGESSKFISTYIDNYDKECEHLIIEQDENWKEVFLSKFSLSNQCEVQVLDMIEKEVYGYITNSYKNLDKVTSKYDLYIVDGPFGSKRYSRNDIITLAQKFDLNDEFIILIDDHQRQGERDTSAELLKMLKAKKIPIFKNTFRGNKEVLLIATKKYKYATSI